MDMMLADYPSRRGGHNRNNIRSRVNLERALKAGRTPQKLGLREIGRGCQNTAYIWHGRDCLGQDLTLIVKSFVGGWRDNSSKPPKEISNYGARPARTYRCGDYVVQECVTVLAQTDEEDYPEAWKAWRRLFSADLGDMHMM